MLYLIVGPKDQANKYRTCVDYLTKKAGEKNLRVVHMGNGGIPPNISGHVIFLTDVISHRHTEQVRANKAGKGTYVEWRCTASVHDVDDTLKIIRRKMVQDTIRRFMEENQELVGLTDRKPKIPDTLEQIYHSMLEVYPELSMTPDELVAITQHKDSNKVLRRLGDKYKERNEKEVADGRAAKATAKTAQAQERDKLFETMLQSVISDRKEGITWSQIHLKACDAYSKLTVGHSAAFGQWFRDRPEFREAGLVDESKSRRGGRKTSNKQQRKDAAATRRVEEATKDEQKRKEEAASPTGRTPRAPHFHQPPSPESPLKEHLRQADLDRAKEAFAPTAEGQEERAFPHHHIPKPGHPLIEQIKEDRGGIAPPLPPTSADAAVIKSIRGELELLTDAYTTVDERVRDLAKHVGKVSDSVAPVATDEGKVAYLVQVLDRAIAKKRILPTAAMQILAEETAPKEG